MKRTLVSGASVAFSLSFTQPPKGKTLLRFLARSTPRELSGSRFHAIEYTICDTAENARQIIAIAYNACLLASDCS